jgi:hypothetical protein
MLGVQSCHDADCANPSGSRTGKLRQEPMISVEALKVSKGATSRLAAPGRRSLIADIQVGIGVVVT